MGNPNSWECPNQQGSGERGWQPERPAELGPGTAEPGPERWRYPECRKDSPSNWGFQNQQGKAWQGQPASRQGLPEYRKDSPGSWRRTGRRARGWLGR